MSLSLIKSIFRSFFVSVTVVLGVGVGALLLLFIFVLAFGGKEGELQTKKFFNLLIEPNAKGVRKVEDKKVPVILKIEIQGIIGLDQLNLASLKKLLVESREGALKKNRVKAILLHVNSPGGTVNDSDGMYELLKAYKERYEVPIYAYADGLMASGSLLISLAADKIFSSQVSLIGSVGVRSPSFFNIYQLMGKVGVDSLTLYAGKGKDNLNPFRPWKEGEEDFLQDIMNSYYDRFISLVTKERPMIGKERLIEEYGAHIFSAKKAKEFGFVDEVGLSLNEVIEQLAEDVKIKDNYQVVGMEEKIMITDFLRGHSSLFQKAFGQELEAFPELHPKMKDQFLYLYRPT